MDTIKYQGSKMKMGKTGAKWLFARKKGGRPGGRKMRGGLVKTIQYNTIQIYSHNIEIVVHRGE